MSVNIKERDAQAPFLLEKNSPPVRIHPEIGDEEMTKQRELDLVQRSIAGCGESFGQLYEFHRERVRKHVYYLVGNPEVADDLTSNTFENAFKAMPRYQITGTPFVSWLLRIAHNQGISHLRKGKNQELLEETVVDQQPKSDPHTHYELNEDMRKLFVALNALSPSQQQAIKMKFVEGFDYVDIAKLQGRSVGAVRVDTHRGLKKIKSQMKNIDELDNDGEGVA